MPPSHGGSCRFESYIPHHLIIMFMYSKKGNNIPVIKKYRGIFMLKKRIWEIDLLRAISIATMIIYHTAYDINEFTGMKINIDSAFWYWLGKSCALTFIFLSGISSGFSKNEVLRGIKVFASGMVITAVTYAAVGNEYVRFGILQFLGVCMVIHPLLIKLPDYILLMFSYLSFIAGFIFDKINSSLLFLMPLGIVNTGFSSIDYFPLFPYISFFITGILYYKLYYKNNRSMFKFELKSNLIEKLSSYSIYIYMLHQPVILLIINALKLSKNILY